MAKNKQTKKELRTVISETLASSLGKLKEGMSEKKFNNSIKKASKVLTADFKISKREKIDKKADQASS